MNIILVIEVILLTLISGLVAFKGPLSLGKLAPIALRREQVKIYFPLLLCLIISIILSVLLTLLLNL